MIDFAVYVRRSCSTLVACLLVFAAGAPFARTTPSPEVEERSRIAAANLEDAIVVDCQLPGKLRKLGGMRTYLTPGVLMRLSAVDCRARGGEYTIGDLSSGTLSLQRWLPLAQQGQAEAQYYVARIYANGMGGVPVDYGQAAEWYQRAAQQNYSAAVQELGHLYEQGLGVQKDPILALNLQRKAAGLGDELDYAWKITAAEEAGARQVAELSEQLSASNADLQTLRAKLQDTTNAVFRSRAELARSESAMIDLREQLASAQDAARAQDRPRIDELQNALAAKEQALAGAQQRMQALTGDLRQQRATLALRMAESQASSMELNELLATEKARSKSLEAQLAQADQRLLQSQQELANQRTQYRAEVEDLVAERTALASASGETQDQAAALLSARERELARQELRITSLEKALAEKQQAQARVSDAGGAQAAAEAQALRTSLAALQTQFDAQQREMNTLRAKSRQDGAEFVREIQAQLAQRTRELEQKQRRIAALASETDVLRNVVRQLNEQRSRQVAGVADEAARARESLRMAQQKLNEQRERLEQLQVEKATERAALAKARNELEQQLSASRKTSEAQIAFLNKDLEARRKDLESRDAEIARLERRLEDQSEQFSVMMAQALSADSGVALASASTAAVSAAVKMRSADSRTDTPLRASLQQFQEGDAGEYHALVIGNSLYRYMEPLDTPVNDARTIGELLRTRYGFKVRLLLDATREQIMTALHDATLKLTPQDSLLIYYAGHGDLAGPEGRAFWLGVEADSDTRAGWLEADHIRAKIKEMNVKHVLLVADSCFSGAITHPKTTTIGRGLNETRLRIQWNRRARMVLTSGQVTPVADSAGGGEHSVFARNFIQILRQNENIMSGEMLSHELSGRMLAQPVKVSEDGQRQTPTYSTLQDANHDVGDFFFVPTVDAVKVAALGF